MLVVGPAKPEAEDLERSAVQLVFATRLDLGLFHIDAGAIGCGCARNTVEIADMCDGCTKKALIKESCRTQ